MTTKSKFKTEFQRKNELKRTSPKHLVEVAFEFVNIGEINTLNEKFQAELIIESKWRLDPDLEENKEIYESEEYNPKKHWNPRLYVENALSVKEDIVYDISEIDSVLYVTEKRALNGHFWAKLVLRHFPVDVQELAIVLTSKIGANKLEIVTDANKLSFIDFDATLTFKDQQKWKLFRLVSTSDQVGYDVMSNREQKANYTVIEKARKDFKPKKIVAKCYAARRPGFYLMNAFFLVFLITSITFAIWAINYFSPHFRLQSTFTILLTSVSFKWVVNRQLPAVSYLTSLDAYQISSIFFICLLATWHGIIGAPHLLHPDTALEVDRWMLLAFGIIYVCIQLFWLVWLFYAYDKIRTVSKREQEYFEQNKDHFLPCQQTYEKRKSIFFHD